MSAPLDAQFCAEVARLLNASPFASARRLPLACVILTPDERRVTDRATFGAWLRANGLDAQAREATRRRVPLGHVLCWLEAEQEDFAHAGFYLFNVAAECRRLVRR